MTTNANNGDIDLKLRAVRTHIESMQEYVKGRHNVHQEIKRMICLIKSSYSELEKKVRDLRTEARDANDKWKEVTKSGDTCATKETQTERRSGAVKAPHNGILKPQAGGIVVPNTLPEGMMTPSGQTCTGGDSVKRRREKEGDSSGRTPEQKKKKGDTRVVNLVKRKETDVSMSGHSGKEGQNGNPEEWTIVTTKSARRKKGRGARKRKKPKPDAIIFEKRGDVSYADILRKVKGDPNLKELGENVARIRRTQRGEMLLEFNRNSNKRSSDFRELVKTTLGEQANVRALSQEITLECRDLDEITTEEDIRQALEVFGLKNRDELAIKNLRKGYVGTQIAIISLPAEAANKLLQAGKVKIGWAVCKVRELIQPKQCYRCLEFGHIARDCNNCDRSKLCRRCGETGHIAKTCEKEPKCMLCTGEQGHIAGSSRCPLYRREINSARR